MTDRDPVVSRALDDLAVPDHAPGFWARLDQALDAEPAAGAAGATPAAGPTAPPAAPPGADVVDLTGRGAPRRTGHPLRILAGMAAAVAAVVAAVAWAVGGGDEPRLVPADRGAGTVARPPSSSSGSDATVPAATAASAPETTATIPGTTTPTASDPAVAGAVPAVEAFLDALGRGDVTAAHDVLGVRSEMYLESQAGSAAGVDEFLAGAAASYGAWASSPDATFTPIPLGPGDCVVVVRGTVTREGATREAVLALPVRHAESAGFWAVEPWAVDPATGARLEIGGDLVPSAEGSVEGGSVPREGILSATVGAEGTFWFALGDTRLTEVPTLDGTATWTVPISTPTGSRVLLTAFRNDTTFVASAFLVTVT
jgi:hypothetical protein